MAGADETPNDRAGSYRPNKILPQNIESPSLVIGDAFAPVPFFRRIVGPRPLLMLSGEDRFAMWGAAANLGGVVTSQQLNMVHRSPSYLCEQTRRIVVHLIAQHVVGCPGELMAQRLDRHDPVRLGHLLLIVAPYRLVEPAGSLGGFDVSPGEILIPVLPVAVANDLAGRGTDAFDTAAVRGVVAHGGEAMDIPDLEHDREGEDLTDARYGHELGELLSYFELLGDHGLDRRYLVLQVADEADARKDHGLHLPVRKEAHDLLISDPLDVLALHPDPEIARKDVLDAQDVGGPVADELEPFPEEVPCGALLFGVDVARGEDTEPEEVREPEGAPLVIDLLQALVLFDGGDVGQMDAVAFVHEAVHEPVPVKG